VKERRYKKPPIIEAVCQIKFDDTFSWDHTIPGMLYERLSKSYPKKSRRSIQEARINQEGNEIKQDIYIIDGSLFMSDDNRDTVFIAPGVLAVSRLAPYHSWQQFKPKIANTISELTEIISETPRVQNIILQYINHIKIPQENVELDEYFAFRPYVGPDLPQKLLSFFLGCLFDASDNCQLRVELAPPPPGQAEDQTLKHVVLRLVLSCQSLNPVLFSKEDILGWIDTAHCRVVETFEGCITDSLRAIFEEEKP